LLEPKPKVRYVIVDIDLNIDLRKNLKKDIKKDLKNFSTTMNSTAIDITDCLSLWRIT